MTPEEKKIKHRDYMRDYYSRNKEKLQKQRRQSQRKCRYGVTPEQYEGILAAQDNRCAICGTDNPGSKSGWHLDHCHETQRVRGVLCHGCNTGLGGFKDNPDALLKAVQYLRAA